MEVGRGDWARFGGGGEGRGGSTRGRQSVCRAKGVYLLSPAAHSPVAREEIYTGVRERNSSMCTTIKKRKRNVEHLKVQKARQNGHRAKTKSAIRLLLIAFVGLCRQAGQAGVNWGTVIRHGAGAV